MQNRDSVRTANAYVLFYRRRESPLPGDVGGGKDTLPAPAADVETKTTDVQDVEDQDVESKDVETKDGQ